MSTDSFKCTIHYIRWQVEKHRGTSIVREGDGLLDPLHFPQSERCECHVRDYGKRLLRCLLINFFQTNMSEVKPDGGQVKEEDPKKEETPEVEIPADLVSPEDKEKAPKSMLCILWMMK